MTKKRIVVCAVVLVMMLLAVMGINALLQKEEKPFQKIKIQEASVKVLVKQETYTISDVETLQELLKDIVVYEQDDSWRQMNGAPDVFTLVLSDGTQMEIIVMGSMIAINGVGYHTEYKTCEKLNDFVHALEKTN